MGCFNEGETVHRETVVPESSRRTTAELRDLAQARLVETAKILRLRIRV